ncbi:Mitochondrial import inner membrane translocase subunit tim44-1 [Thalictrum thalictroides]|uniref:Mitochondrial import inner membrane translocase subunit tim44-1 n=1 Tax=Thalictrum thalictroides TaxID=46969 RepID=A0A7J6WE27_THATH|nr:Mitochondrial import inner membrane translocase subunit tim44-1 [Thalictrum thalictroides]
MGSRKLVRDLFLSKQLLHHLYLQPQQVAKSRLPLITGSQVSRLQLIPTNHVLGVRRFSILDEFNKKVKGEVESNPEFQKSIKDLKEKAESLKGVKEELKVRTKKTTEDLYKRAEGAWTEAEATAKKVSANVKEKISATTEEVKGTFGLGKKETSGSTGTSSKSGANVKDGSPTPEGEKAETSGSSDMNDSLLGWFKSSMSYATPKISSAFQKVKDVKIYDYVKKGYDMVKDELNNNPSKKKRMRYEASASSTRERSTRTDIVVVPVKQSRFAKKWETFKEKINQHPMFKQVKNISEPVVTKGQEIAEDVREGWETSDHPAVHKIQDLNERVFGETDDGLVYKEIRSRDPFFELEEFVAEVQEMIKPTLNALHKGDVETLKKNCSPEVIERLLGEQRAYQSQGIFFDNKILHVSDVTLSRAKLMGSSPIIIVSFNTQQIFCARNKDGSVSQGGENTIVTAYYEWAMQLLDAEEQGEGAVYPVWRLREMRHRGAHMSLI